MSGDKEKGDSCCTDSSCSSTQEKPKELKFKKNLNLITATPLASLTDTCCTDAEGTHSGNSEFISDDGHKTEFLVHGMDCSACANTIEKAVRQTEGISQVQVNYSTGKMKVVALEEAVFDKLPAMVGKLGYTLEEVQQKGKLRTYNIEGMDCGSCALTIENHLKSQPSVKHVNVHFASGKMTIEHDSAVDDIVNEIAKVGFKASLVSRSWSEEAKKDKSGTISVVLTGILLLLGFTVSYSDISEVLVNLLYAAAIVLGGYKAARSAFYAVKSRSLDMNVLMMAAVLGAAAI